MVNMDEIGRLLQLSMIFRSVYKFLLDSFKVPCGYRKLKMFEALPSCQIKRDRSSCNASIQSLSFFRGYICSLK